ncbi:MAG: oligosaccharide flippase family protein [Bacteroidota bacterium]|nr:oligosaccharide flippase family protein [Bacteroidota bacterium]
MYIRHLFKDIRTILYHSSLLLSGSVIAQIISVIAYPFLTRLYSPAQFGEFSVFLSITGILAIISTGRFEYALMLPKETKEAEDLKSLGLRWCLTFCFFILIICTLAGIFIKPPAKIPGLYLIPFYVFTTSIIQIFSFYRNRLKEYPKLAQLSVFQNITATSSKLLLGFSGLLNKGLVTGSMIGQMAAALFISDRSIWNCFQKKDNLKAALSKYAVFPKYRMVQALINALSANMPILFITYYFTAKDAGYFAIILGLGYKVITLVSSSLYQVMYQRFTELKTKRQAILPVYKKMSLLLLTAGIMGGIPVFLLAKPIITLYLGNSWTESIEYLKIMLPWLVLVLVVTPFAFIADVFSLQRQVLIFDIVFMLLRIAGLYAGFLQGNVLLSVVLYCLISIAFLLFIAMWYFWIIRKQDAGR